MSETRKDTDLAEATWLKLGTLTLVERQRTIKKRSARSLPLFGQMLIVVEGGVKNCNQGQRAVSAGKCASGQSVMTAVLSLGPTWWNDRPTPVSGPLTTMSYSSHDMDAYRNTKYMLFFFK